MSKLTGKSSGLALVVIFGFSVAFIVGLFQAESIARQYDGTADSMKEAEGISAETTAHVERKAASSVAHAAGSTEPMQVAVPVSASDDVVDVILSKLRAARPDLVFTDVKPSVLTGLYEVEFNGGGKIYSSATGDYFIAGEIYQVQATGLVNLSEFEKNGDRATSMASLKAADMIVFSPAKETKASIYVFTDVDCGYCRLLHKEVPRLNELGIEVRYLAFPGAGLGSESYKKVASAWCSDDKLNAMNLLKAGQSIPNNVCADNPVASQYNLGQKLGVNGTPAIVLESGELIPGYVKADELVRRLNL